MTPHDEWDYDGVNEMILVDQTIDGKTRKTLVHFDRNGFGYTIDRLTGELLVAEKFDPAVNWATAIDMDKTSKTYGRPQVDSRYSTDHNGEETTTRGICPSTVGAKNANPAAYSPRTDLFLRPRDAYLHGLRAIPHHIYRRSALYGRRHLRLSAKGADGDGRIDCLGCESGQDHLVE